MSSLSDLPEINSVIYLRGIQHQEMESILEFMYLGVATFYQERMNEFLNVAKNLEIKEISKDVEFEDENVRNEEAEFPVNENHKEVEDEPQTITNTDKNVNSARVRQSTDTSQIQSTLEGKFECDKCESQFKYRSSLVRHIQSIHEGVKYACNHCDQQFSQDATLHAHIRSIHEGVKYTCNQCDQQFSHDSSLLKHIRSKHEGVKYACNKCHKQFALNSGLYTHIKSNRCQSL